MQISLAADTNPIYFENDTFWHLTMTSSFHDTRKSVIAIVVTYNPNTNELLDLLAALQPQVGFTIVVDNASRSDISAIVKQVQSGEVEVLKMSTNMGIAAAQNAGIERAMTLGAKYVLLSDQDSTPSATMVEKLLFAFMDPVYSSTSKKLAAVGPATIDSRTGEAAFFVIEKAGLPRRWKFPTSDKECPRYVEVGFLIASGTLIPISVIRHIGMMRSSYFIDHVDTEWCFRAKAAGYVLLGIPAAKLRHSLGDTVKTIWFFGSRQIMYHTPLRDYYMFRNTLLMLRETKMSLTWKLHFLFRLFQFAAYFLVFSIDRKQRAVYMAKGLAHGFSGESGGLDTSE
jgi:rhamnosyltransferase